MVPGYHSTLKKPPSPVSPSEPPQQVVRGPAGCEEVGGQWDSPTQHQELRGPGGWGPPQPSHSNNLSPSSTKSYCVSTITPSASYPNSKLNSLSTTPNISSDNSTIYNLPNIESTAGPNPSSFPLLTPSVFPLVTSRFLPLKL